jgi:hypothetical protein
LSFNGQKLTHIQADLFHSTPLIEWISFNDNLLTTVERALLFGINSLRSASFLRNPCASLSASQQSGMVNLGRQLAISCPVILCPPGEVPQPPTTQVPDTTTISQGECGCSNEIEGLRREFNAGYFELRGRVAVQDERLTEVERRVREIDSNPAPFEM